jgi:deoxycytidine triphosphate deaminase
MELESGDLVIDPIDAAAIGPSVVDLRLAPQMRVYRHDAPLGIELRLRDSSGDQLLNFVTDLNEMGPQGTLLAPGDLLIGYTAERIQLPNHLCGWVEGRSGFARLGLAVHNTAPILHAGWGGHIALELSIQVFQYANSSLNDWGVQRSEDIEVRIRIRCRFKRTKRPIRGPRRLCHPRRL